MGQVDNRIMSSTSYIPPLVLFNERFTCDQCGEMISEDTWVSLGDRHWHLGVCEPVGNVSGAVFELVDTDLIEQKTNREQ